MQRLKEAKAVTREAHPTDGRRNLVRLAPELVERASLAFHPMVAELDRAVADFDEAEQRTLRRWLVRVAELSEEHAERAHAHASGQQKAPPAVVPSLWG